MEALNVFAIPHSVQVSKLLEIFFYLGFSTFNLYFAFLFGGVIYSLYFYVKTNKTKNEYYLTIARNFIEYIARGYVALIGLGFVPLLSIYYSLLQFMQKAPNDFFVVLFSSTLLFILFVVFLKTILFFFEKNHSLININPTILLLQTLSIIAIFFTIYLTNGISLIAIQNSFVLSGFNIADFLDLNIIFRIIQFIGIAFVLSSLAYIFKTFTVDKVSEIGEFFPEENGVVKKALSNVIIWGNILPIISLVIYVNLPKSLVTLQNYILLVASLLVFLLCLLFSYFSLKNKSITFAKNAFFSAIFSFLLFFGSDATSLAISNKIQEFKISKDHIAYHEKLLASAGRSTVKEVNGEEIYKAKCVACHQFDTKLVGPPHKEVLKKYEDRQEDMVRYILNPVKVDPNYPPMPNQGLKPNEAEAVVKYMFDHYGNMIK